jgi:glycosyltransferase involved in cell wall biosynthesis
MSGEIPESSSGAAATARRMRTDAGARSTPSPGVEKSDEAEATSVSVESDSSSKIASRWIGYVDRIDDNLVHGWACDLENPNLSVAVELVASNGRHVVAIADVMRVDVKDAGFGNGIHGYAIDISELKNFDGTIIIRFLDSKTLITKSPIDIDPQKSILNSAIAQRLSDVMRVLATQIRHLAATESAGWGRGQYNNEQPGYPSRAKVETLFEASNPAADPQGLVSKHVLFELQRLNRSRHEFVPDGELPDRLKVLRWYLTDYNFHRQRQEPVRIPLSAQQVNFLNSPAPLFGGSSAVTVAFYNFVTSDLPSHLNVGDRKVLEEAMYWWCIQKLPSMMLEDRLVTAAQVELLCAEKQWVGEAFPLNAFMVNYFDQQAKLQFLDMSNPRDRAALLHYLILLSFTQPHIARYLPRDSVQRALKPSDGPGSPSMFERVLELCTSPEDDGAVASAKALMLEGERRLHRAGLSLTRGGVAPQAIDAHSGECFAKRWVVAGPIEDGVALIGPVRATSGLGQATRLSLEVLSAIETLPTTTIDFDMDNPALTGFATDTELSPYKSRRSINLLHLNAESIPLAFAYLQHEIFERSYNIGYFFWELNKLPKCHGLALEMLDEIWVSSEYDRAIYQAATSIPVIKVGMAVESLPAVEAMDRTLLDIDASTFVFLTVFDSFSFIERKNPLAVVKAFALAFPNGTEDVRLIFKTQNRRRVQDPYQKIVWANIDQAAMRDPRISVVDETYKYRDLLSLKLTCDCYVSLHRSEGWGFGMIEAMQLGIPVICTAYSGNMEFCNEETAYLVDYDLIAPIEEEYIYVERGSLWADPRRDIAAARMREVANDREAARAKGRNAARFIGENFSVEAIGRRYRKRLTEIRALMQRPYRC